MNIIVTGGTDGIGLALAKKLLDLNNTVIIVGKNHYKGEAILKNISNSNLKFFQCDLSEKLEIDKLIDKLNKLEKIDVLVNNAGAIFDTREVTSHGVEKTFALNHLSYFYLTLGLIDNLELSENPMIINVASQAHKRFKLDLNDIENKKFYSGWKSYCRSKLLNILFTYEFSKRYNIRCNCIHPGFVNTNFGNNNISLFRFVINILKNIIAVSPEKGSESIIHLIMNDIKVSGKYFVKSKEQISSKLSYDEDLAKQVWELSYKYIQKHL